RLGPLKHDINPVGQRLHRGHAFRESLTTLVDVRRASALTLATRLMAEDHADDGTRGTEIAEQRRGRPPKVVRSPIWNLAHLTNLLRRAIDCHGMTLARLKQRPWLIARDLLDGRLAGVLAENRESLAGQRNAYRASALCHVGGDRPGRSVQRL